MDERAQKMELLRLLEERKKRRIGQGIWAETAFERRRRAMFEAVKDRPLTPDKLVGFAERLEEVRKLVERVEDKLRQGLPLTPEEQAHADQKRQRDEEFAEHERVQALREAERAQKGLDAPQAPACPQAPPAAAPAPPTATPETGEQEFPRAPGRVLMPIPRWTERPKLQWS